MIEIESEPAALIIDEVVEVTCREGLHHSTFDFIYDLEISDAHGALGSFGYGYYVDSVIVFTFMLCILSIIWISRYYSSKSRKYRYNNDGVLANDDQYDNIHI